MGALSVPPLVENSERNILLDANPSPVLLDLRVREEQVRSVPAKKSFSSLILPPTARSRQQSRGLHPVGALSVPPLEWYPLGTVRPTRVTAKQTTKRQALRLPPTARSQRQSRGLHPVGAVSVPPLEWCPLRTVRPV